MDIPIPLVVGGIFVFIVGFVFLAIYFDRKRTEAMERVAKDMGLQFAKDADHVTGDIQSRFVLFRSGRSRKAERAIYGEANGTGVWIFDYEYTTGSGKESSTHHQTVACLASSELNLTRFELYREGMMSRIGASVFGMQDIDFDSHPEFSKKYVLKGDSEEEVRALFTESLLSFFESQDRSLRIEGCGDQLLVYRARKRVSPAKVQDLLTEAFGIFREFQAS